MRSGARPGDVIHGLGGEDQLFGNGGNDFSRAAKGVTFMSSRRVTAPTWWTTTTSDGSPTDAV